MTVTEILQLVDRLVFTQTGNHLNNLQKNVVQGIWQGKTYAEMAKEFGYDSENHIGNVSRELYKILSEQLGENVNKSNFCATLERLNNSYSPNSSFFCIGINSSFNLCPLNQKNDATFNKVNDINLSEKSYHDLTLAPKITHFYDRTLELQTLSHWLTTQNPRLISVLGLSGIGKTTLVKRFVDLNIQQFDVIIWKSLKLSHSLDTIITEIFTLINPELIQTDNKLTQLTLLNLYECNPVYLKDIASLIKSILGGKVSEFLREDSLLLTEDMKFRLGELFDRLSAIEKQIVLELSKSNQPVSREDLREALSLSSIDLINGLQSLKKRYLLKTIEGEKILFDLSAVFREYGINYCQD